ncbi:MAG: hypothetical protein DELT_01331 [Desulfovibrio sp.]
MLQCMLCLLLAVGLTGCNDTAPRSDAALSARPSAGHTAQTALDYYGVYRADGAKNANGAGSEFAVIELGPNGRYRVKTVAGEEKTGAYRWDATGRIVTLTGYANPEPYCFVGENYLRLNGSTPKEGRLFVKDTHPKNEAQ